MIYLIRHADAVPADENPVRPLSAKGRGQIGEVCKVLRGEAGFKPAEIWHSPLERSRETAELLAQGLGLLAPLALKPGLEPEDDPGRIAAVLAAEDRDIAIVGHEPHLGALATLLAGGPARAGEDFAFRKAAVLAVSRKGRRWRPKWLARSP
ncbi:MAG TPA: phosphoglycerate mutase family protein [Candidatus Sulfotelmatobacter sp.]|nr:phosphoglycerate mutase family protein [Candidatus Sulfotelmatobacter sp.]